VAISFDDQPAKAIVPRMRRPKKQSAAAIRTVSRPISPPPEHATNTRRQILFRLIAHSTQSFEYPGAVTSIFSYQDRQFVEKSPLPPRRTLRGQVVNHVY